MIKNKILYIGLTEDPKITPIKKLYSKGKSGFNFNGSTGNYIYYTDEKYQRQLRYEVWEQVERNTYRITRMNFIKNNILEGEQISVFWD
jgi:hypothetical protein